MSETVVFCFEVINARPFASFEKTFAFEYADRLPILPTVEAHRARRASSGQFRSTNHAMFGAF